MLVEEKSEKSNYKRAHLLLRPLVCCKAEKECPKTLGAGFFVIELVNPLCGKRYMTLTDEAKFYLS